MKRRREPHKRITALRAIDILYNTEIGSDDYKIRTLREAIREHLRAPIRSGR